ncbi:glycosyltransferase [Romboutsia sedimentorum]|uniref:glycosyltransferase n=1 Tax=Romboutsia sedimentorum TaxID=1368474 RepID=UPI0024DEB58A|nr:glycosyltransferase [Romboutsia sedimentorum]MDK2586346.1 glycosyltransferase [Romboutsia sedimentorum]
MKILYLNNVMTVGGVTKCILKLCKEFQEDIEIVVASHGGQLLSEFKSMGIKHYEIYDVENKNPISISKNVKLLIDIIKNEDIDIVHSHHRMTTLLAKIASKFTGVKVIHTQHLCIEDKFKLTKLALNGVEIITVSEAAKRILHEKSNLDKKNITTIYNTIEVENEDKNVDSRLIELKKKEYFVVAQVSRIIDYKGVYDFVEVARKTVKENNKIRFVLIGDGPEYEPLRRYIKNEGLEEYIYMLGSKNNVINHLKYIDLLLLCSYIEGLPLAPLEAFSQSIPVIATNIDGTNEEVKDGYNGFLVEVKDVTSFKNSILKIYQDKCSLIKLKENAYKSYCNNFDKEKYIKSHKEKYINLKCR